MSDNFGIGIKLLVPSDVDINKVIRQINAKLDGKVMTTVQLYINESGILQKAKQIKNLIDQNLKSMSATNPVNLTLGISKAQLQNAKQTIENIQPNINAKVNINSGSIMSQLENLQNRIGTLTNGILGNIKHLISYGVSGGLLFGGFHLLDEGLAKTETGVKGLATVLPELIQSQEALNQASKEFIDIMQKYGTSVDETFQGAKDWGRMYHDQEMVQKLLSNSALLALVDNLKLEESVKGLESTMAQYGMTAKTVAEAQAYSSKIMDSWTLLAHRALISANDLAAANERSAKASQQAGISYSELQGLLSTASRMTGLPGANLGTMMKSVAATISSESKKAVNAIESIGVSVHNANGQLRSAYDIILDLSLATSNAKLSTEDLNEAIKQLASGKFQYSKAAAMVGQFDEIIKNTAISIKSQGATIEMAHVQLDTLDRKLKQLHATLIDVVSGAGDKGLRGFLKDSIDTINAFVLGLDKVSPVVLNSTFAIGGLGLAFAGLYSIISKISSFTTLLISSFTALTIAKTVDTVATNSNATATARLTAAQAADRLAAIAAGTAIAGETVAKESNTVATNALTAANSRMVVTNALATGGITILLGALATWAVNAGLAKKKQEELNNSLDDNIATTLQKVMQMQEESDFMQKMVGYHEQLRQKIEQGNLSEEEATKTKKYLIATEDALKEVIGEEGYKRLEVAGFTEAAVKDEITAFNSKMEAERKAVANTIDSQIKQTQATKDNALERIRILKEEANALSGFLKAEEIAKNIAVSTYSADAKAKEFLAQKAENAGNDDLAKWFRQRAESSKQMASEREQMYRDEVENERQRQISEQQKIIDEAEKNISKLNMDKFSLYSCVCQPKRGPCSHEKGDQP